MYQMVSSQKMTWVFSGEPLSKSERLRRGPPDLRDRVSQASDAILLAILLYMKWQYL